MSEAIKRSYRFTGTEGRAFRFDADSKEHVALKPGEVVRMAEKTAEGLKDRFELVADPIVESEPDKLVVELTAEELAEIRNDGEITVTQAAAELAKAQEEASEIVSGNVEDSTAKINVTVDVDLLELVEEAENEKTKPRAGVLRAINERIEKILSEDG